MGLEPTTFSLGSGWCISWSVISSSVAQQAAFRRTVQWLLIGVRGGAPSLPDVYPASRVGLPGGSDSQSLNVARKSGIDVEI